MSDYSVSERCMADVLPDQPAYRGLCRVFSSRLMLAAFLVALVRSVLSLVVAAFSYPSEVGAYRASLSEALGGAAPAGYDAVFDGVFLATVVFVLLLTAGIAVLELLPQWLLISRARRGRLLGRKPFTVLRTYTIVLVVLIAMNLFFSLSLTAALQFNTLSVITLAIYVVFYVMLVRMLGIQRELAMWGQSQRRVSYKATAFVLALQIIPTLASLLLTVLQFVNPDYFKLTAYTSVSTPDFLLTVFSNLLAVLSTTLYALTILRAGREFSGDSGAQAQFDL